MHHTEICLSFPDETAAERGLALFRDMIRTAYASRKKVFPAETGPDTLVLCQKFFLYRNLVRGYDPGSDFPFCRISCLKREACDVILDKAADLQQMIGSLKPREDEFFIQLCESSALAEPDTPFHASCVFEETVSGTQQIARAEYRDRTLRMRLSWQLDGEPEEKEIESVAWQILEG